MSNVGLVIIGRNEGERLRRCLESAQGHFSVAVYVDSGSTDGSVALARSFNVEVVDLDTKVSFTAARARNAGAEKLLQLAPQTQYIQFVDGDCEINADWWNKAIARLNERSELAVVCGRRRERFPEKSVYNRLCDIEWNTPVGDADACGGDSMMRVSAFTAAGGFDPTLIAGEEPELCLRLRQANWKIERLDAEMTLHDAAMFKFSQWWKREKRSGWATAEGASMYGHLPERYRVKSRRSNWVWGLFIPLLAIALAWPTRGVSLLLLALYPLQWFKMRRRCQRTHGVSSKDASSYATYIVLGKIPQMMGQITFITHRLLKKPAKLIEYKGTDVSASTVSHSST